MVLGLSWTASCALPYSGNPERLSKPRKKKRPEVNPEAAAETAPVLDDKCRTNFFDEPTTRRKASTANQLSRQAEPLLVQAEEQEGPERISSVKDALSKLKSALKADPYSPEATYRMAVAYALVGKKGCAVALLERLQELTKLPGIEGEAERTINRAARDQNFDIFRKDADTALGR